MVPRVEGSSPFTHPILFRDALHLQGRSALFTDYLLFRTANTGASPSGKASAFDADIRWFESSRPCHSARTTNTAIVVIT